MISCDIDCADCKRSSLSGSGFDNVIPLFYLEASSAQFEIPTNATLGGSRNECKTFKGLWGDISARPISSIMTTTIALPLPSEIFVS